MLPDRFIVVDSTQQHQGYQLQNSRRLQPIADTCVLSIKVMISEP